MWLGFGERCAEPPVTKVGSHVDRLSSAGWECEPPAVATAGAGCPFVVGDQLEDFLLQKNIDTY